MTPLALPSEPRVLIVVLRRLGDVLLTTPLMRSIKRAFPAATVDALVFAGTEGILQGNPDLGTVITLPQRPSAAESFSLLRRLRRRYDLALSVQAGDRPTTFAVVAGKQSAGLLEADGLAAVIKRLALSRSTASDRTRHRVLEMLRLAELVGVPPLAEVVPPAGAVRPDLVPAEPYAVVHAAPMFVYKRWTAAGWRQLAAALRARGLRTVVTGAGADAPYLDEVFHDCEVMRRDGALAWPELAAAIGGARLYVGPDTAITHLAAATGTATVALFGPTDPRIWGPWPAGGLERPWDGAGTIQRRRNVWLVQNPLPCLPCQEEGCERRVESFSRCLDELSAEQATAAVDQALAA